MSLLFLNLPQAAGTDLPWPDVYFSPQYGAAAEASDDATWEVAVWEQGPILMPYLVRTIPFACGPRTLSDVASPYGYSGTWAAGDVSQRHWRAFRTALRTAMRERGILAEFQRLHPLFSFHEALASADPSVKLRHHNDTVVVDLLGGYEAWWNAAEGRVRTAIRKAKREGLVGRIRCIQPLDMAPGSSFRNLYRSTMERVHAGDYFFFSDEYFSKLGSELADQLLLAEVLREDGRLASAALLITWGSRIHYHLAGSEPEAARLGANALLLGTAIEWAIQQGIETFHIGGGRQQGDPLFLFKRGFGTRVVPFYTAQCVIDDASYEMLVHQRAAITRQDPEELVAAGYFPAYRA